jgi:hypothetical protein
MSLPSKYGWRFYLLTAHLTDENLHTACNRQLPHVDLCVSDEDVPEDRKCVTCKKFEQRGSGSK